MESATGHVCATCGVLFPHQQAPKVCPICSDDRQYVPPSGQRWLSPPSSLLPSHANCFRKEGPGIYSIRTEPKVGIGQRALLIQTHEGNVLWDCITLIDEATVEIIKGLGGIKCIAVSHPHYYSSMVEWSRAFGDVPIYIHALDRPWLDAVYSGASDSDEDSHNHLARFAVWEGESIAALNDVTLVRLGGHFAGAQARTLGLCVLHWSGGAGGKGVLCTGDILQVCPDKHVSVMRSYPNLVPLSGPVVRRVRDRLGPWDFDVLHGAFHGGDIREGARGRVERSFERYLKWVENDHEDA
eukprot:jgi/Chlat1/6787/Chrsp51S06487